MCRANQGGTEIRGMNVLPVLLVQSMKRITVSPGKGDALVAADVYFRAVVARIGVVHGLEQDGAIRIFVQWVMHFHIPISCSGRRG